MLDLDAEVLPHLDELTGWVQDLVGCAPQTVVDLGAGTGTGTFALARRFPHARLLAVDSSAAMLEHLRSAAAQQGVGTRVGTVEADVDARWPDVGRVDLVWAASSLHHLHHPGRVMADVRDALHPGGLMMVVEMDELPRFLPHDLGFGRPGLEDRCHEVTARRGHNAHPDWGPHLQAAGMELLEQRSFSYRLDPAPMTAHRYAQRVFAGIRAGLADDLAEDDLAALDRLLDDHAPGSLAQRRDLVVRSTRTAWAARRA